MNLNINYSFINFFYFLIEEFYLNSNLFQSNAYFLITFLTYFPGFLL